jgi:hypothetical protein
MSGGPSIIERAFELARSGAYSSNEHIIKQLKSERYESVEQHLSGPSLKRTLRDLCKAARATPEGPPSA